MNLPSGSGKRYHGKRVNVSLSRSQEMKLAVLRHKMNLDSDAETVRAAIKHLYALHNAGVIDLVMLPHESPMTLENKCQKESTAAPDTVRGWLYPIE